MKYEFKFSETEESSVWLQIQLKLVEVKVIAHESSGVGVKIVKDPLSFHKAVSAVYGLVLIKHVHLKFF